jgi:HD superfamily phosphohydrolase
MGIQSTCLLMKNTKRIRTVLYGDQRLSSAELEVLHTPAMQRLYGLKQLGLTDRVFIDASHARIHHVVGVLEHVDKLVSAIDHNLNRSDRVLRIGASKKDQETFSARQLASIVRKRKPVIRLIGLLHDLTHAPFGHTVEDEIRLVQTKHDEPERQSEAFYKLLCQIVAWFTVELEGPSSEKFPPQLIPFLSQGANSQDPEPSQVASLAKHLITTADKSKVKASWRLSQRDLATLFAQLGCAMTALLHLEALHKKVITEKDLPITEKEYPFQSMVRNALLGTPFEPLIEEYEFRPNRDAFMLDIVGNTVCADLLDYAKRDSHFAGLKLDYDADRIAENFTLVSLDASAYELKHSLFEGGSSAKKERIPKGKIDPFAGWCLRTAISLVSHKYRTDVPSELMNLLNVRFYLYERAIYHPTKCAAGSILGTALQLLGWRQRDNGKTPTLPDHLRYVGDEVFLHDIRCALKFILEWLDTVEGDRIEATVIAKIANVDRVHNGLVQQLLELRIDQALTLVREELMAARLLLDRLAARRYFRPVFRALPSSDDPRLQAGAEALAQAFREPEIRFEAERRIEMEAHLPLGTITIHCPTRTTAQKIANVLLTKLNANGEDEICKLQDIGSLDGPIFGEHQKAVKAVEQMYRSMWRLAVYLAPEHFHRYREIGEVAGKVVFKTIDKYAHFADRPDITWLNDPQLANELNAKLSVGQIPRIVEDAELSPLGELVGRLSDHLIESGRLTNIPAEFAGALEDLPPDRRARIEEALVVALSHEELVTVTKPAESGDSERTDQVIAVFKTHTERPKRKDLDDFKRRFHGRLQQLPKGVFDEILSDLHAGILETETLNQMATVSPAVNKGYRLSQLVELLEELFRKHGISPSLIFDKKP